MRYIGDSVTIIPKAGANYTDAKTVGAVQSALDDKGYDPGPIDGILGPKTKKAVKKLQADMGYGQTGVIDENVIRVLQVTPGVLPPGVTLRQKSLLEAQVALDAATKAEHSVQPTDVQDAAQAVDDAASSASDVVPPEVKAAVAAATAAARAAKTPAEVQAAAVQVKAAAQKVQAYGSWWTSPLWNNAPITRGEAVIGGGVVALLGTALLVVLRRK